MTTAFPRGDLGCAAPSASSFGKGGRAWGSPGSRRGAGAGAMDVQNPRFLPKIPSSQARKNRFEAAWPQNHPDKGRKSAGKPPAEGLGTKRAGFGPCPLCSRGRA